MNKNVKKIGIEIWQPYIDNAEFKDCTMIQGDIREFETLVDEVDMDCCLMADVLEHFTKIEAITLMNKVRKRFNRILLMIPEGIHEQHSDVTGYEAHEYQTHRSTWYKEDIIAMGFAEENVIVDPQFHSGKGCIFAV